MPPLTRKNVTDYVEAHIGEFHDRRIQSIETIKLNKVLSRKNPYLFKAKNLVTAAEIVRTFVDAHLSSQEETIFGNWLEGLAIHISGIVYGGTKSGIEGIDLEFNHAGVRHLVVIKSGPAWGNSSQIKHMVSSFNTARKTLRTSGAQINVRMINGCCYGKDNSDKGTYEKVCGQKFWEMIGGDANLYIDIIEPLGHKAREKNEEFATKYGAALNRLTKEFTDKYCNADFTINWEAITKLCSQIKPVTPPKVLRAVIPELPRRVKAAPVAMPAKRTKSKRTKK